MEPFRIFQKTSILGRDLGSSSLKLVHLVKKAAGFVSFRLLGASVESFGIFQKTSILGLDFGASSLKLVHLVKQEAGLVLVKADIKEHTKPEDAAFREEERLSFLKELLTGVDVQKTQFSVCINSSQTAMRIVTVPLMPPAELKEAIRLEAKNYFPFPVDTALLDFEVLGETFEEGIKKLRVIVATAPRKTVEEAISLLKKVGAKPSAILPVPYALYQLAQLSPKSKEDKTQCLVDVGYSCAECIIIKWGTLIFSRKIPVGGADFTKALTGVLATDQGKIQLTLTEAEKIKREMGIPAETESKASGGKVAAMQVLSMLHTPLEQFAGEIDRSFGYYREEHNSGDIHTLVLSGRGAALKGILRFLSQELGLEAKVGQPLKEINIDAGSLGKEDGLHFFSPALGAAMRNSTGLNLLPPEMKEETKQTVKRAAVKSMAAGMILIFVFIYVGMRLQLSNYKKRIDVAHLELSSLRFDLEKAEEKSIASRLVAGEPYWEDVFMDLSNIVGGPITLTSCKMEGRKITLRGVIAAREKEGFLSVFISNLERAIFSNVKLVTAREMPDPSTTEFEVECWVD